MTERCLKVKLEEGEKRPPSGYFLLFATKLGLIKKTDLHEYVRINRNGKYALRFKLENDSLVNVQQSVDSDDVVMKSQQPATPAVSNAMRFVHPMLRVSGGVYGIKVAERKGSGGGFVAGMLAMSDYDSQILTISKYGMAKRSRLGTAERIQTSIRTAMNDSMTTVTER